MIKRFSQFLSEVRESNFYKVVPDIDQYDAIRIAMLNTFDEYANILEEQATRIAALEKKIAELESSIARRH